LKLFIARTGDGKVVVCKIIRQELEIVYKNKLRIQWGFSVTLLGQGSSKLSKKKILFVELVGLKAVLVVCSLNNSILDGTDLVFRKDKVVQSTLNLVSIRDSSL